MVAPQSRIVLYRHLKEPWLHEVRVGQPLRRGDDAPKIGRCAALGGNVDVGRAGALAPRIVLIMLIMIGERRRQGSEELHGRVILVVFRRWVHVVFRS